MVLIFLLTSLLLLGISNALAADIHKLGYSSVDGRELRWGGYTKYSSNLSTAITNWNNLGKVKIAPDTIWTYEDVVISDVRRSDFFWDGAYKYWGLLTDNIYLNTFYLDSYTFSKKTGVVTHELGHALGIGDHYSSTYANSAVMYYSTPGRSSFAPRYHDKVDYNSIYP